MLHIASQELSVSLSEVCDYIADIAPTVPSYFLESAVSPAVKPEPKAALPSGAGGSTAGGLVIDLGAARKYVGRPPTSDEVKQWKSAIVGKASWAQVGCGKN